ncbi:hypothetical protein J7E50_03230 [Pedobacter sp. ISL-68]|uniref:hypothetical protein n=1 Tax=unclassified Pedobacter TaxID=2628915 RepID=UPI001BE67738|nr:MULTISPECIES: hypothetical protein [unclassified Pedobacter]MBT2560234.1 hypothetical protein [Pedobacter sp. ISL-64]MBT2589214.1 hypothetical protein [Pedobacter sp. ISL-68]
MKTKKIDDKLFISNQTGNGDRQTHQSNLLNHNQCTTTHNSNENTDDVSATEMLQMLEENIVPGVDHLNIFSFWMLFG